MPYRRSDSDTWWASYTDASGKRVRRSTGTENRKEAEAVEAKWKLEIHQQQKWGQQPTRTFDELMLAYLKATEGVKRSSERDLFSAKRLYPFFSGKELGSLAPSDIRAYIEYRRTEGVQSGTINRELGLLSAAINYARMELEWEIPNPVTGRRLREPEGRVRWLTEEEANRLIKQAESQLRAPYLADFIRLALNTGCRLNELLGLEWRRVDMERRIFFLSEEHTKSARRRSIPLNNQALLALSNRVAYHKQHCPESPWVFCHKDGTRLMAVKKSFAAACEAAGIEDFHIHDLRHTCAAWLVTKGVPLPQIRDLLGHSSVTMTERYAHLAPETVRAAVSRLDGMSRFGHGEHLVSH
ncbi:MAG: site-specific integrase [Magnetococcales bacterium]|nr:site-specific integrase [Magnetococcales bacterium]NGZ26076.1 site-specific integrase [Magnetococcales bacterium]